MHELNATGRGVICGASMRGKNRGGTGPQWDGTIKIMTEFSDRMKALYEEMQREYDKVAAHYGGFSCMGCQDNCCTQRFFHHTLAEYLYLKEGVLEALRSGEPGQRDVLRQMLRKSRLAMETYLKEVEAGEIMPLMCPVNVDGLCALYSHRPMICRMHGMPHRFKRPDGREERGGGCARFGAANKVDWTVNRTKVYRDLASIESGVRRTSGFSGRYARTTAEMLMDMVAQEPELRELMEEDG